MPEVERHGIRQKAATLPAKARVAAAVKDFIFAVVESLKDRRLREKAAAFQAQSNDNAGYSQDASRST